MDGPFDKLTVGIMDQGLSLIAAGGAAALPASLAYVSARGTENIWSDLAFAERQKKKGEDFYNGCIEPINSVKSKGKSSTKEKDSSQPPETSELRTDCFLVSY